MTNDQPGQTKIDDVKIILVAWPQFCMKFLCPSEHFETDIDIFKLITLDNNCKLLLRSHITT